MTGAELKLLCYINGIKSYDIANTLGISHGSMTRYCQPTRTLQDSVVVDILRAMKELKGNANIVTSVSIDSVVDILKTLD